SRGRVNSGLACFRKVFVYRLEGAPLVYNTKQQLNTNSVEKYSWNRYSNYKKRIEESLQHDDENDDEKMR
ncbi:hypothetical protein DERF_014180, partial [Dermatophagoides farinae]